METEAVLAFARELESDKQEAEARVKRLGELLAHLKAEYPGAFPAPQSARSLIINGAVSMVAALAAAHETVMAPPKPPGTPEAVVTLMRDAQGGWLSAQDAYNEMLRRGWNPTSLDAVRVALIRTEGVDRMKQGRTAYFRLPMATEDASSPVELTGLLEGTSQEGGDDHGTDLRDRDGDSDSQTNHQDQRFGAPVTGPTSPS